MTKGPNRDEKLRDEAQALWRALSDAPPPADASGDDLLAALLSQIPAAPGYDRLRSPFLRPSQIARPTSD
jgi:hypothetical protein